MISQVSGVYKNRQAGSALFYALLFAAIVSIAVSQVIRMTEQSQAVTKGDELKSARDKLRRRLQTQASLDDPILKSQLVPIGMNEAMRRCMSPATNANCAARKPEQLTRFALYAVEGQLLTSNGDTPAYYDKRGNPCGVDLSKCVFEATSYFWAICHDPNDTSCALPETLYTLVQVRMLPGAPVQPALAPIPRDSDIFGATPESIRKWASHMAIDQIINRGRASECPPGQAPVLSTGGAVKCQSVNDASVCPIGTLFTGVNSLGQPNCQTIGKSFCVNGRKTGTHTCTDGLCKQNTPLDISCPGSPSGRPRRLVALRPNAQGCRMIAAPAKKNQIPDGIGTHLCTTDYDFTCCE